mgnify:FL=1
MMGIVWDSFFVSENNSVVMGTFYFEANREYSRNLKTFDECDR